MVVCVCVALMFIAGTVEVYLERSELARFSTLWLSSEDYYKIGIVLCVYVPQYWVTKLLWRGLDYFLVRQP